jgi:hypothetical protein
MEHSYGGRVSLKLIPTHPVNIPCGRKPEYPEKTYDIRKSVDRLFSHECPQRGIEATTSEAKSACSEDCVSSSPVFEDRWNIQLVLKSTEV